MAHKKRIFYFDLLRALAIISVILIHVFSVTKGLVKAEIAVPTLNWFIGDFMLNFFRIGVPIFLMLSGALSLGREWEIRPFLEKRIVRIVLPFIFWIVVLSALVCVMSIIVPFSLDKDLFGLIYNGLTSGKYFYQMWFFWMILGTYLIMPIFNKWILHSDLKELEYFLVFWLITCIFDYTVTSISFPLKLSYFTSPMGLVVLGYYLRYTKRKLFNNTYIPMLMIVISAIGMIFFSYMFSTPDNVYYFDRYSIFVAVEAIGIYLLFRNSSISLIQNPKGLYKNFIESLSKYSYGMYLVHVSVLRLIYKIIPHNDVNYLPWSFTVFILVLFGSWGILYVSNQIPYINEINGVK